MSEAAATPATSSPGYVRYVVVILLLGLIRVFEAATDGSAWRALAFDSYWCWFWFSVAAVPVSFLTVSIARRHFPAAITILLGVLAGATTTLMVSTYPGMAIGLVVGALGTYNISRWFVFQILKYGVLTLLPGGIMGLAVGFFGGMSVLRVSNAHEEFTAAMTVCGLISVAAVCWGLFLRRYFRTWSWLQATLFAVGFLTAGLLTVPLGIQFDTTRRVYGSIAGNTTYGVLVPLGYERLVRGYFEPSQLYLYRGLSEEEGELLSPFREIENVRFTADDKTMRTEGLQLIDFSSVSYVDSYQLAEIPDEALLAFSNSSAMTSIRISGAGISDRGLAALRQMEFLSTLDLSDTQIEGSGLQHLHRNAPLNFVDLSGTDVDDQVLEHLSGDTRMIDYLSLRNTLVTGAGFRGTDFPVMRVLYLANSKFQEEYIDDLPLNLNALDLSGVRLSTDGLAKLAARFSRSQIRSMFGYLTLNDSRISDDGLQALSSLPIIQLNVDATRLTSASANALAKPTRVQLWFSASELPFAEIADRYRTLRAEILRKKGLGGQPIPDPVTLSIHGLTVREEMVDELRTLEADLPFATIAGEDAPRKNLDAGDLVVLFAVEDDPTAYTVMGD